MRQQACRASQYSASHFRRPPLEIVTLDNFGIHYVRRIEGRLNRKTLAVFKKELGGVISACGVKMLKSTHRPSSGLGNSHPSLPPGWTEHKAPTGKHRDLSFSVSSLLCLFATYLILKYSGED